MLCNYAGQGGQRLEVGVQEDLKLLYRNLMINKLRITKIFYLFEAVDFYFDFLFNFIFVKKIEVCIFINLVNREAVKTADNIGRF